MSHLQHSDALGGSGSSYDPGTYSQSTVSSPKLLSLGSAGGLRPRVSVDPELHCLPDSKLVDHEVFFGLGYIADLGNTVVLGSNKNSEAGPAYKDFQLRVEECSVGGRTEEESESEECFVGGRRVSLTIVSLALLISGLVAWGPIRRSTALVLVVSRLRSLWVIIGLLDSLEGCLFVHLVCCLFMHLISRVLMSWMSFLPRDATREVGSLMRFVG